MVIKAFMSDKAIRFRVETFIWVTAFILSNFRGTVFWDLLKQGFQLTALPQIEIFVWIVLFVMAVRSLVQENLVAGYVLLWKQNWILVIFIVVALLSIFWSVSFSASLYRSAALLFSSLIGAYIGLRYSITGLLNILFRFGTLLLIVCFTLAVFLPIFGAMIWEPYHGAWRGVFWHKNHLGSISVIFSLVFLIFALDEIGKIDGKPLLYIAFYLFSLVVIFFSRSAAGYILFTLMSFFVAVAFVWLKTHQHLRTVHYYGVLSFVILVMTVVFLNLEFVLGLFNRDTSLTGRIPLWNYLIHDILAQSLWFGYGFGAIWSIASFRIATQQVLGWGFPVAIADNGFLDILLHVGLIGFVPFLGVLIISLVRSFKYALHHNSLLAFFPFLIMVFTFFANISFSLFLETEMFVWLIVVAVLFMITKQTAPTSL